MPPETSQGMAGLLKGAGVTTPTAPKAPAPAVNPSTKGMAGLLADAKDSTIKSPAQTTGASVKAPLFGDVGKALTTQTDQTHQGIGGFFSSIGKSFTDAADQLDQNVDEWGKGGVLNKIDALGKTMLLPVNVFFSPITAALQSVQGVPVVGQLADGLNRVFGAIGAGGGDAASIAIDHLPISQQSKDAIRPLAIQLGALAAQIATGKIAGAAGGKVIGAVDDATGGHLGAAADAIKASPIGQAVGKVKATLDQEVIPSSLTSLKKAPAAAPTVVPPEIKTQVVDTAKQLGHAITDAIKDPETQKVMAQKHTAMNTPIKPSEGLFSKSAALPEAKTSVANPAEMHPTLRAETRDAVAVHGPAATHTALMEEMGASHGQAENLIKHAPVPQNAAEEIQAHNQALAGAQGAKEGENAPIQPTSDKNLSETAPKTEEKPVSATEPKPLETAPGESKIGKSIEAKAIEQGLTKGYGGDTAHYDPTTFKEQAEKSAALIDSGIDNARAVVRGEKPLPQGLREEGLIAGMELYAKNHPAEAAEIHSELANSSLVSKTSEHAQGTSLARMREPDSATTHLQNIKKALVEKAGGADKVAKAKASIIKGARTAMKAVNLTKEEVSWDKFLDTITC